MFYLMNRDNCIAVFIAVETGLDVRFEMIKAREADLPVGFRDITAWLHGRKAISHNGYIRRLAASLGCADDLGYLRVTHAGSLNDTFWVKEDTDPVDWRDVSYYANPFSEIIAHLAFTGQTSDMGIDGVSPTLPEMSTAGSFPKCWHRDPDGEIWLMKGGRTDLLRGGSEPYCEVLASEVYHALTSHSTRYEYAEYAGAPASKCRLFTSEEIGFVPIARFHDAPVALSELMSYVAAFGWEEDFRAMILADCLTLNPDRHRGNFGFLVRNDTQERIGLAPAFDFNQCFLPYGRNREEMEEELQETWPKQGRDFISLGRQILTPSLRQSLLELTGYCFHFRGDTRFSSERVTLLEDLLQQQVEQILA